ncbi:MAG: enoyl-ACP reductase [Armatimonadota bacterium]|nr:enoyl-ACP reductase [Armatimonadota bacterium]MDR7486162.1 enoyl-ACP reductase [Armatimonadota bacterium]MDR7531793.1 enoyl-ACP reductase [Armatimonadota bacterium]MDR7534862.1 enoyl-ACP reductase [Armatimonadota bacterium]
MLLHGKRALIMGVANKRSIAWGIARAFHREGAQLAFTYQSDRLKENLVELLTELGGAERFPIFPCDVQSDQQIDAVFAGLAAQWGALDVLVHCLAFAGREELARPFTQISRQGYAQALEISAYSLLRVAGAARGLLEAAGGGTILTLTYNAVEAVVPSYGVMAIAKAALECEVRYLAAELGPANIRVNAISAGPLRTLAASAVRGITAFRDVVEEVAPLRRNISQEDVGDAAVFLASDLARSVTGNTLFVDSGFHVMGAAAVAEMRGKAPA